MNTSCEHPVLIFNPNLVYLFSKFKLAVFNGHVLDMRTTRFVQSNFPWKDFYAARNLVTPETIDNFVLCDRDGQTFPVFYYVPCGKCRLCRSRKVQELQTRCICESHMQPYKPLFVTLTYAEDKRPTNMAVCLADFQKFMKRLRIDVDRKYGKHTLRYMAVSEYTPKNHYPHIHMLLWGLPYIIGKNGEGSFFALNNYIAERWSNGYCKCEVCRDSSGKYCMKYMKKGDNPDCWMQASRRNGIGYSFAIMMLPYILKNPDIIDFIVTDQHSGKQKKCIIPSYFRTIWYPTLSKLFPANVCKSVKVFLDSFRKLNHAIPKLYGSDHRLCSELYDKYQKFAHKYCLFKYDFSDKLPDKDFRISTHRYVEYRKTNMQAVPLDTRVYRDFVDCEVIDGCLSPVRRTSLSSGDTTIAPMKVTNTLDNIDCFYFRKSLIHALSDFRQSFDILDKYTFDSGKFRSALQLSQSHSDYVRSQLLLYPSDKTLQQRIDIYKQDIAWMESHWMQQEIC